MGQVKRSDFQVFFRVFVFFLLLFLPSTTKEMLAGLGRGLTY
jgi:hypothetical protein